MVDSRFLYSYNFGELRRCRDRPFMVLISAIEKAQKFTHELRGILLRGRDLFEFDAGPCKMLSRSGKSVDCFVNGHCTVLKVGK